MNISEFRKLLAAFSYELDGEDIESIYIYGSQVGLIGTSGEIPFGKEVDLAFIKKGKLKDGEKPISDSLAKQIFSGANNTCYTFNGVWDDVSFEDSYLYFDILSEGSENINELSPSAKIFLVKRKILVWGTETEARSPSLSRDDIYQLVSVMSRYVNREFIENDTRQNQKSVFKNGVFLISLKDESTLCESDRDVLIKKLMSSKMISKTLKQKLNDLVVSYKNKDHKRLCSVFNEIVRLI
ncbi:MAG: hypothetical protein KGI54_13320 [Pseudomonadota bacterium]|nr:hypothetical protein [Pseudomonadota bacterium]